MQGSRAAWLLLALILPALAGCVVAVQGPASALTPEKDALRSFLDGDYGAAEQQLRSANADCRRRRDGQCEVVTAIDLALCQRALDDLAGAEATLDRAVSLARQLDLPRHEAAAASNLANVLLASHRYRESLGQATSAAGLAAKQGMDGVQADAMAIVALSMAALGNRGGALAVAEEAEKTGRRIQDARARRASGLQQLATLGAIHRRLGDCDRAQALLHEVLDSGRGEARPSLAIEAHVGLARCARSRGDGAAEREHLRQARAAEEEQARRLKGRARISWSRQTLYLAAAEQEALLGWQETPGSALPPGLAYAFALLYESDGNAIAELRALLRVPRGGADRAAAEAMAAPLLDRVRIVSGGALPLRESPDAAAASQELRSGALIELVGSSGQWLKVRTEKRTGFLLDSQASPLRLRAVTRDD